MNPDHETTCDQNNNSEVDGSEYDSDELQLQDSDAVTINEINFRSESGKVPLPLPEQDRQAIAEIAEKKARVTRITILEALLGISLICLVLALTNWMPLPVLTLCLGCTAVVFMLGFFDQWIGIRYRRGVTWLLIISYLLAAAISLMRY